MGSILRLLACGLPVLVVAGRSLSMSTVYVAQRSVTEFTIDGDLEEQQRTRTVMQCLGTQTLTRACHFQNIYYDLNTARFVHYGIDGASADVFGDDDGSADPWLRLTMGHTDWQPGQSEAGNQFYMDWRPGEPLPRPEEVAVFGRPLHLRSPYNTKSIGHLLRDNLQFLVDLPLRFGRDPGEFDWVRWRSNMKYADWEEESSTAEHYRGLLNNRPSLTWQQVLDEALKLAGSNRSRVKYIRFEEMIAGRGPADIASELGALEVSVTREQMAAWAHMCGPFPFTEMRRIAYRNFGLQAKSVHELEPFVLFLDGQPDERRHLVNAPELLPNLKATFPGVRFKHTQISTHSAKEQLELLARATVLVSNIGSRSFRLMYLPNGATTILVGPPEYEFELVPPVGPQSNNTSIVPVAEVTPFRFTKPFIEIDWCWGYIGYVSMLRYRVQSEAEVQRGKKKRWTHWIHARNTDILLDEHKITALLTVALNKAQHSTAQRGSGVLSAYAA